MEEYKKHIDRYDVVSFDIFDTLLARNVSAPVDVFTIAQELFNQESNYTIQDDFRPLRIKAEREARLNRVSADVTLDDIYRELKLLRPDYPDAFTDALRECELKAEAAVLVRNSIAEVYDYARKAGKKIAIVSDMYLPKQSIESFLKQNGIDEWDFFLVSCEDHLSKASGTAFVALRDAFPGKSILHIGDNYHDDITMATRHGLGALHIQSNVEACLNKGVLERFHHVWNRRQHVPEMAYLGQVQQSIIDGLTANYIAGHEDNTDEYIGYAVLGPLLVGFSQWLHESAKGDGCDKILFLARDGAIMHKAYNLLYGSAVLDNEYIFGSRRALVFPSLQVLNGEDIRTFAQLDRGASLTATLETFNLTKTDVEVVRAAQGAGVDLADDHVDASNAPQVEAMLLSLKEQILATIKEERGTVLEYLDAVGFGNATSRVAVCDIGWNGSVRTVIENYVGREVPGFYLGLRNVEKTQYVGDKIKGYFDARKEFDWREFAPVVAGGVEVVEFLFSNPDQGPIKKIEKRDGQFVAPENQHDFPEERREMMRRIQSSALKFIVQYQEAMAKLPRSLWLLDRHSGLSNIVNLIDVPTSRVAHAIGTSPYATSVGSRPELIGAPVRDNLYYRTHWMALRREASRSFWAQGFRRNAEDRGLKLF